MITANVKMEIIANSEPWVLFSALDLSQKFQHKQRPTA